MMTWLLWQTSFWPCIFPSDATPFHSKEVRRLFGPWTTIQENMGPVYFVRSSQGFIHMRNKQAFIFNTMPQFHVLFFRIKNKSDSENDRALHRIPFSNKSEWEEGKKMDQFCNLSLFMLKSLFHERMNPWNDVTKQTRPTLLNCRSRTKKAPSNLLALKG